LWAQGGIAAAVSPEDSPRLHLEDTLRAGRELCNRAAVEILTDHAPEAVKWLEEMGVLFDRGEEGIHLGREGGHSRRRILHSGGSASGKSFIDALTQRVRETSPIQLVEHTIAAELVVDGERCYGIRSDAAGGGSPRLILAPVTILATGGAASLFERTSNPPTATGDGIALAYRAGAEIADMEFMQFHPTALVSKNGWTFLISEAVRGEGAYLFNTAGKRFMPAVHEMAELAPRDVVASAIHQEMRQTGSEYVLLSAKHLPAALLKERFPNIYAACLERGFDMTRDLLPVAPAAHYTIGGVRTDLDGRTSVKGLLACGEVACTGVHGANRLASNSLLECLVFARRAVEAARQDATPLPAIPTQWESLPPLESEPSDFSPLAHLMTKAVGIVRSQSELACAQRQIEEFWGVYKNESLQWRNRLQVARLITQAALLRTESRGAHRREDFPHEDPNWKKHIVFQKDREPRTIEV